MNTRTLILVLSILLVTAISLAALFGGYHAKYKNCNEEAEALRLQLDSLTQVVENSRDTIYLTDTIYTSRSKRGIKPKFVNTTPKPDTLVSPQDSSDAVFNENEITIYNSVETDTSYEIREQIFVVGELIDIVRDVDIKERVITNTVEIRDTVTVTNTVTNEVQLPKTNSLMLGASYHQLINTQSTPVSQLHFNVGYEIKDRHQFYLTKSVQDLTSFSVGYNFLVPLK